MQRTRTLLGMLAGAAALVLAAGATTVNAASPAPADTPAAVPTVVTLPLFGAPLTVDVTTGPGGTLTSVTVDPADGWTATNLKPKRVVFENSDGTAKVKVGTGHGGQSVSARAGSLDDISGPGSWSGDVFGTGAATTVDFTIGAAGDGGPDITGVSSSDATADIGTTQYHSGDHHGHHGHDGDSVQTASVRVTFTSGGQSRSLMIVATVKTDEDGTTKAGVSVSLGRLRGVAQPVDVATGDKTWTGQLCDGSTATINYTVNADGTLTFGSATPDPQRVKNDGGKIDVRFARDAAVRIRARLGDQGITVNVSEMIRCRGAADPAVNTPVSTTVDQHQGDHHGGDRGGDGGFGGGDHHRRG